MATERMESDPAKKAVLSAQPSKAVGKESRWHFTRGEGAAVTGRADADDPACRRVRAV